MSKDMNKDLVIAINAIKCIAVDKYDVVGKELLDNILLVEKCLMSEDSSVTQESIHKVFVDNFAALEKDVLKVIYENLSLNISAPNIHTGDTIKTYTLKLSSMGGNTPAFITLDVWYKRYKASK